MTKELRVIPIDTENILLTWDEAEDVSSYALAGVNNIFISTIIKHEKKDNKLVIPFKEIKDYLKLQIYYLQKNEVLNKDIIIAETNEWSVKKPEFEQIELKAIESYKGYTLSFHNENIFDKYYVYEIKDNYKELIIESEDFQVTSELIKKGKQYYVEAYLKKEDIYELKAKSDIFTCEEEKQEIFNPPKLSIVIPIFNAELFLARTIDSILLSTFKEKEIILVDDGSTDNSKDVIDWYVKKYKGIISFYTKGKIGVSFVRNLGIEHVKGEYTGFVDSDDMIHPYMYEKLYNLGKSEDIPIVIGKTICRKEKGSYETVLDVQDKPEEENLIYTFADLTREEKTCNNIFFVSSCNKIVKSSLVKEHPFPDFNYYEDTAYAMMLYSYANKFGFNKKSYYMWDQRLRNTVGSYSTRYDKIDSVELNIRFVDALFFISEKGNPNRINYIAFYAIKELYEYLIEVKYDLFNNPFAWAYIKKIKELNERVDLLKDPFISCNQPMLEFVKKALES